MLQLYNELDSLLTSYEQSSSLVNLFGSQSFHSAPTTSRYYMGTIIIHGNQNNTRAPFSVIQGDLVYGHQFLSKIWLKPEKYTGTLLND